MMSREDHSPQTTTTLDTSSLCDAIENNLNSQSSSLSNNNNNHHLMIHHLNLDILQFIFEFLPACNRNNIASVNRTFFEARFLLEKHEMIRMWMDENACLKTPLLESVVSEEVIEKREHELGFSLPLHLKLFLTTLSNGRKAWTDGFNHVSNLLGPIETWKVDSQSDEVVLGVCTRFCNVLTLRRDGKIRLNRNRISFANFVKMIDFPFRPQFYDLQKFKERKYFPFSMSKGPYSILPLELRMLDRLSIESILKDPKCYAYAPPHIKAMKRISKIAFMKNTSIGTMIPNELREDSSFIRDIFEVNPSIIRFSSPTGSWWSDREFMIRALNFDVSWIRKCSEEIRNDKDIIHMIIEKNAKKAFPYIGKFREDVEIVKKALMNSRYSLVEYLSSDFLLAHREIVLMILQHRGESLENMPDIYRKDRECFFIASRTTHFRRKENLYKITENDRDEVKQVLKYNPSFLEGTVFQNDRELFKEAVSFDGYCMRFSTNEFKADKEIVLEAVRSNGCALRYASNKLKDDEEIVLAAVMNNGRAISFASKRLSSNQKIIRARRLK